MRVGFPILGGLLGDNMGNDSECYDYCDYENNDEQIVLGLFAGAIAASVIDAVYLAKGDAPKPPEPSWSPSARASQGGFTLGASGRF